MNLHHKVDNLEYMVHLIIQVMSMGKQVSLVNVEEMVHLIIQVNVSMGKQVFALFSQLFYKNDLKIVTQNFHQP